MIKKRIAIFFVLFATILLLAHAVVPHHHHKSHVCITTHHCQSDCTEHQHGTPINDHQHNGESDSEFCVLKQAVFIPSNQGNQFDKYWSGNDKPLSFPDFQAVLFDNGGVSFMPDIVLNAPVFLRTSLYLCFFSSPSSLRAPPVA